MSWSFPYTQFGPISEVNRSKLNGKRTRTYMSMRLKLPSFLPFLKCFILDQIKHFSEKCLIYSHCHCVSMFSSSLHCKSRTKTQNSQQRPHSDLQRKKGNRTEISLHFSCIALQILLDIIINNKTTTRVKKKKER